MKKTLTILLLVLLFGVPAKAFNDLSAVPFYAKSIQSLKEKNILKNTDNFSPQKPLLRAELVQMMYLSGIFPEKCSHPSIRFSDTQLNQWYTPALRAAVLCGVIKGDKNKAFRPNDAINYGEAATLLYRATNASQQGTNGPWYDAGISFLKNSKVTLKEDVTSETSLNRAQGAFLLEQILDKEKPAFLGQKLVESARKQKGIVTSYDAGYYAGGFPPENTGACTDVIERAMRNLGYDWKGKIDEHMRKNPHLYPSKYDENINYRRVQNVKIFLDHTATSLPLDSAYLPGDLVTYGQIPTSFGHIAIVSNLKASDGTPLLIHNYGQGVKEDNLLNLWPAAKTGHYRLKF